MSDTLRPRASDASLAMWAEYYDSKDKEIAAALRELVALRLMCPHDLVHCGWANAEGTLYAPEPRGHHANHRPVGFDRPVFVARKV